MALLLFIKNGSMGDLTTKIFKSDYTNIFLAQTLIHNGFGHFKVERVRGRQLVKSVQATYGMFQYMYSGTCTNILHWYV